MCPFKCHSSPYEYLLCFLRFPASLPPSPSLRPYQKQSLAFMLGNEQAVGKAKTVGIEDLAAYDYILSSKAGKRASECTCQRLFEISISATNW